MSLPQNTILGRTERSSCANFAEAANTAMAGQAT